LPPEMLPRVFDLFAQADRTLDRSQGGLGIGLTVARKLAEMHGGSISAASDGLGRGSTFTIRLPLADRTAVIDRLNADETVNGGGEPRRILVVDDNRDTALGCAAIFRARGHEVQVAYDGVEALSVARASKPEAIFLDIGLPGMNGFDVVKTLRNEGFTNELIIAVSGYGQPEDRQRSNEAGFDEHLVKPVHEDILIAALRRAAKKQVAVT
jgi:CheY-like chemotaxis protein